jgi:hypothetical protein
VLPGPISSPGPSATAASCREQTASRTRSTATSKREATLQTSTRVSGEVVAELNRRFPATHIPDQEIRDVVEKACAVGPFGTAGHPADTGGPVREVRRCRRTRKLAATRYFRCSRVYPIAPIPLDRGGGPARRLDRDRGPVRGFPGSLGERLSFRSTGGEAAICQPVMPSMRLLWSAGRRARQQHPPPLLQSHPPDQTASRNHASDGGWGWAFRSSQNVQQL